ncbi:VOC family protein [Nocardia sp. NPDC058658]|uniref:VOC family protein n=1 Tax=Nocardia sp. NPDC058658 TaxID=3346580 RepID=UPI003653595D
MTALRCSHVQCRVRDIGEAVADFTALGFTIAWGSDPRTAHNALIWFADGPFIELYELPTRFAALRVPFSAVYGRAAGTRLAKWAQPGEGWRDLAVETSDITLAETHRAIRGVGLPVSRVVKGKRTRPDGQRVRYEFLAPRTSGLPFVVSGYAAAQRDRAVSHANGARAVATVHFGVADRDRAAFDTLVGDQRRITVRPATSTGVLGIELSGLATELDPSKLHGAAIGARVRDGR